MSLFGERNVRRPAVVGWGQTEIGDLTGQTPTQAGIDALRAALSQAELNADQLDGIFLVPEGYSRASGPIRTQRFAEELGIGTRSLVEIENGGSSVLLAFKSAIQDIASGHLEVAAVVGAQVERKLFENGMDAGDLDRVFLMSSMYGPYCAPYGLIAAVPCYALAHQRYMHEHNVDPELIAELPVLLRSHAVQNDLAEMRTPITVDDVMRSRIVCPPIHLLEACPWSDGAAAVIVASEDWASKHGLAGVAVTGFGEAHDSANFIPFGKSLTQYPWIGEAAAQALERAGRSLSDVDVMEIYGAFAASELMTYEAIGMFGPGEAAAAVARGETNGKGDSVINPSGGRLSLGHPPQATPLLMVAEVCRQLTGGANERQVEGAQIGLVQAEHGMMNGSAIAILEAL